MKKARAYMASAMVLLMVVLGSLAGWAATSRPSIAVVEARIVGVLSADSLNLTVPIRSDREARGAYKLQVEILDPENHIVSRLEKAFHASKRKEQMVRLRLAWPGAVDASTYYLYRVHYALWGNEKELHSGIFSAREILRPINLYVYAQNVYQAGSRASLRVLVTDESGAREIKSGRLEIDLEGEKQRLNLFRGTLGQLKQGDFHFRIPDDFIGEYELKVRVETEHGRQSLSQKIDVKKSAKILLTTDKPVYQPLQTIANRCESEQLFSIALGY